MAQASTEAHAGQGPAPVATHTRIELGADLKDSILRRQVAWTLAQASVATALWSSSLPQVAPELCVSLALGAGAVAAWPKRAPQALLATAGASAAAVLVGLFGQADSTIALMTDSTAAAQWARPALDGAQIWAAGATLGAALPWIEGGPRDGQRVLQGALGGAIVAGLGTWAGTALGALTWTPGLALIVGALVCALVCSQAIAIAGLRFHSADRVPSLQRIEALLPEVRQAPAIAAAGLDSALEAQAPDPETRDGLGEVAAWVFRLQWTLCGLDHELDMLGGIALEERIVALTEEATNVQDDLTRERKLATVQHLERLRGHRRSLLAERERADALAGYALAYLEEARVELALARVQPGDHTPERLHDVLHRLRAFSADRAARRETAREVSQVVGASA